MTVHRLQVALMLLVASSAYSHTASAQAPDTVAPTPGSAAGALRPGDAVRITVFRNPELSGEFTVAADGSLRHPLYRNVKVTGLAMPAVDAQLRTFMRRFMAADSVFVVEPLLRVTVGGEVARPNVYTLSPETSIAQAAALAGGPTERGRRDRLVLSRNGRQTTVALRGSDGRGREPIMSGDEITVERQRSMFRDVVTPTATLLGATAAIINVFLYNRR